MWIFNHNMVSDATICYCVYVTHFKVYTYFHLHHLISIAAASGFICLIWRHLNISDRTLWASLMGQGDRPGLNARGEIVWPDWRSRPRSQPKSTRFETVIELHHKFAILCIIWFTHCAKLTVAIKLMVVWWRPSALWQLSIFIPLVTAACCDTWNGHPLPQALQRACVEGALIMQRIR